MCSEPVLRLLYRAEDENSPHVDEDSPYNEWGQERYTAEEYEALWSTPCAPEQNPEIEQIFAAFDESVDEDLMEMAEVQAEFSDFDDEIDEAVKRDVPFQEISFTRAHI